MKEPRYFNVLKKVLGRPNFVFSENMLDFPFRSKVGRQFPIEMEEWIMFQRLRRDDLSMGFQNGKISSGVSG